MGQLSPWKHSAIRESIAIENETAFETMPTAQKQTANPADGLGFLGVSVTDPLAQHKPVWEGLVPSLTGAWLLGTGELVLLFFKELLKRWVGLMAAPLM